MFPARNETPSTGRSWPLTGAKPSCWSVHSEKFTAEPQISNPSHCCRVVDHVLCQVLSTFTEHLNIITQAWTEMEKPCVYFSSHVVVYTGTKCFGVMSETPARLFGLRCEISQWFFVNRWTDTLASNTSTITNEWRKITVEVLCWTCPVTTVLNTAVVSKQTSCLDTVSTTRAGEFQTNVCQSWSLVNAV